MYMRGVGLPITHVSNNLPGGRRGEILIVSKKILKFFFENFLELFS